MIHKKKEEVIEEKLDLGFLNGKRSSGMNKLPP